MNLSLGNAKRLFDFICLPARDADTLPVGRRGQRMGSNDRITSTRSRVPSFLAPFPMFAHENSISTFPFSQVQNKQQLMRFSSDSELYLCSIVLPEHHVHRMRSEQAPSAAMCTHPVGGKGETLNARHVNTHIGFISSIKSLLIQIKVNVLCVPLLLRPSPDSNSSQPAFGQTNRKKEKTLRISSSPHYPIIFYLHELRSKAFWKFVCAVGAGRLAWREMDRK